MVIILMGVSGCGKTAIGQALAKKLDWPFYDGDDFHSTANVGKMRQGRPLTDEDRLPWLKTLSDMIRHWNLDRGNAILACSALKERYRDRLGVDQIEVKTVFLKGCFSLIRERLNKRRGHFMNPDLLTSQLETLEAPNDGLTIDIKRRPDQIVAEIIARLKLEPAG